MVTVAIEAFVGAVCQLKNALFKECCRQYNVLKCVMTLPILSHSISSGQEGNIFYNIIQRLPAPPSSCDLK